MEETHGMPHHNLADFEPWLGYATEGQAVGGISFEKNFGGPSVSPTTTTIAFCGGKSPSCYGRKGKVGSFRGKAQGH